MIIKDIENIKGFMPRMKERHYINGQKSFQS